MTKPTFTQSAETIQIKKLLETVPVGGIMTFASIEAELPHLKIRKKHAFLLQSAMRALLREKSIVFASVRGVGVKRATDEEIEMLPANLFAKVRRAGKRTARKLLCVEFEKLAPAQKIKHVASLTSVSAISLFCSDKSQKQIESKCSETEKQLSIGTTMSLFASE